MKIMKVAFHFVSGILFVCQITRASEYRDTIIVKNDTVIVSIKSSPFLAKAHKIDSSKTKYGLATIGKDTTYIIGSIDGRQIWGTDGGMPRSEIKRFEVKWNGKRITIPSSLYSDCFDPILENRGDPIYIQSVLSEDHSSLMIEMKGSDGAGSYEVWWIIAKNGKHSRFIQLSPFA